MRRIPSGAFRFIQCGANPASFSIRTASRRLLPSRQVYRMTVFPAAWFCFRFSISGAFILPCAYKVPSKSTAIIIFTRFFVQYGGWIASLGVRRGIRPPCSDVKLFSLSSVRVCLQLCYVADL